MDSEQIIEGLFIKPNCDIQKGNQDYRTIINLKRKDLQERWKNEKGQSFIKQWRANSFDREFLEAKIGKFNGQIDLRGIDLSEEDLEGKDLSNIDFFCSDFSNTNLGYTNLKNSYLSECKISGTQFDFSLMEGVIIDNAKPDNKTSFTGVDLNSINFTLAILVEDLAKNQQRIANLKGSYPLFAEILRITCDYGRSFQRFLLWCLGIILIFGFIYWIVPNSINEQDIWHSIYFSGLTFMTMSLDIKPISGIGKGIVVIELVIGYLMTALLVAILLRRTIGN